MFFVRLFTFMLGIILIVLGIAFATPIKLVIDEAMGTAEINCAAPATDYDQATCWWMQIEKALITGFFIFLGFAILVAKEFIL